MKKLAIFLIKAYQYAISPFTPASCRFQPTCSAYAVEAIQKHGAFKGLFLAIKRVSKCHPFNHSNPIDPVPPISYKRSSQNDK